MVGPAAGLVPVENDLKGRKRLTVLIAAQQMCLFAKQSATYKGRELPRAPRTEPYGPNSGIRLPLLNGS